MPIVSQHTLFSRTTDAEPVFMLLGVAPGMSNHQKQATPRTEPASYLNVVVGFLTKKKKNLDLLVLLFCF